MTLHALRGHREVRARLAAALRAGTFPQVLLLTGPKGIGKQRVGLWIGQLLLCQAPGDEPCGTCPACRKALELVHPDLHWFPPVERPKATEPDRQVEELEETVAEVMASRRAAPLYQAPDGMASHFVATARLLQRHAGKTPVEARRKVLLIGEASRLVPQESSPDAANALLKLFEEPPEDTNFILTAVSPSEVLPTIRSRAVVLRLGRLSDAEVTAFLEANLAPKPGTGELKERVVRAQGAIGMALSDDAGAASARRAAAGFIDEVLAGPGEGGAAVRALGQTPWAARGEFTAMLDAMVETLSDATRVSLGQGSMRPVPPHWLQNRGAASFLAATERVVAAREAAQGNVNPQLLLATLADELAGAL